MTGRDLASLGGWLETWHGLGVAADIEPLYSEVVARYGEPHRHYHTKRHLEECFQRLAELESLPIRREEVVLALWFHDVVYDPRRGDNEEASAAFARTVMTKAGLAHDAVARIVALILATRHTAQPQGLEAQAMVDADLGILAADWGRFEEYEAQIREEYAWVPATDFRSGRAELLEGFLARPAIFHTPLFVAKYEEQARQNIARSLRLLRECCC